MAPASRESFWVFDAALDISGRPHYPSQGKSHAFGENRRGGGTRGHVGQPPREELPGVGELLDRTDSIVDPSRGCIPRFGEISSSAAGGFPQSL
jgi:hypothetical protein